MITKLYIAVIGSLLLFSCSEERQSLKVEKSKLIEGIYSSVTIEPKDYYTVNSNLSGRIINFDVNIGDTILAGDLICLIDAVPAIKTSENAALNLKLIKNQLSGDASLIEDINLQIETATYQYNVDSTQLNRIKTLHTSGNATDVELDQAELKTKLSLTQLNNLISKRKRMQEELKIQQDQASNTYFSSMSSSEDAKVKSILNGIVYDIYKETGELITPQQPIALIGSQNDFNINMLIDEVDITKVKVGQKIYVDLDAYQDQVFEAKVDKIYPKMDPKSQSFEVIATFIQSPPQLYLGLTGEANIVVSEKEQTLVIPRNYLIDNKYVETDQGKTEVKTGLKNLSHVEILSGLKEGSIIYLPE